MKLTVKIRNKLELTRLEGLQRLLKEKYNVDDILKKVAQITKTIPKDISILKRLSRWQFIDIIEKSAEINEEDIDKYYEEYKYGLKPGFAIFSFNNYEYTNIQTIEKKINDGLNKINYGEYPRYKGLIYKNYEEFKNINLFEFDFTYLCKHTYIDESSEPNHIYELEECFVWFNPNERFIAIKNAPDKIIDYVKLLFKTIYKINSLIPIKLTSKLRKDIFGDDRKKANGININASENEAEKISIADPNLKNKPNVQKQLEKYEIKSEYLNININNISNTLGVNCDKGKIYLSKNVNAREFREWSTNIIKTIINYVSENMKEFEIFKAKNIMGDNTWEKYKEKNLKLLIEEILFNIVSESKITNINNIPSIKCMQQYFLSSFRPKCIVCNETAIVNCNCGSYTINYTLSGKLICNICGEELINFTCEEGHENTIYEKEQSLYWIPKSDLSLDIYEYLRKNLNYDFEGYFYIYDGNIITTSKTNGVLLSPKDLKEFNNIIKINMNILEKERFCKQFEVSIKEKCSNASKINCDNCSNEDICINKLFSVYGYRTTPHHGHEFGDINFNIELDNKQTRFVGIAKSWSKNFTRSSKEAREMLQQIFSATQDKRIGLIGAICPSRFDNQFKADLEYLAKCTESKIIILDDEYMIRLLKIYTEQLQVNDTKVVIL